MAVSGIELTHLRYFTALAEELHFGRAAARLHIAQPPLTRQIKLLEDRLQCRLFERTSRSTRLTPAGERLLEAARSLLSGADLAFQAVQKLGRGEEGQLTLATAPTLMLGALPYIIRAYRKRYKEVDFRLNEMASSAILQAVQLGNADLGLIRGLDKFPEIDTHLRWKESMVAILPRDHRLAAEPAISAGQLRSDPFVFFHRHLGPSFYDEVITHCRRAGFEPAVSQSARQWSSIVSLVSAGFGVSIGPASVAALLPKAARCVPLVKFHTWVRIVGRHSSTNPAVTNFLEIARGAFDR
jgi:DNA-binding transcriptional LysR family regulator